MKKTFLISSLILLSCAFSNAVSNDDLLHGGREPNSSLQQFKFLLRQVDQKDAFAGFHSVNRCGWYLTTQNIFDKMPSTLNPIVVAKHNNLDLILIYFFSEEVLSCNSSREFFFSRLASSKILIDYRWVLSLSVGSPLGAVSYIEDGKDNLLLLNKGNINNFYRDSDVFFKEIRLEQIDKDLARIEEEIQPEYKSIFFEHLIKRKESKIDDSKEGLVELLKWKEKIKEDLINSQDRLKKIDEDKVYSNNPDEYEDKMTIKLREIQEKQKEFFDLLEFKIKIEENTVANEENKRSYWKNISIEDPVIIQKWEEELKDTQTLKNKLLREKARLEQQCFTIDDINNVWNFRTPACNGVADSNDTGGGIYSCSNFLIGLTIPGGIDGETSKAINVTTPEVRKWMFDVMYDYYKNKEESSGSRGHKRPAEDQSCDLEKEVLPRYSTTKYIGLNISSMCISRYSCSQ